MLKLVLLVLVVCILIAIAIITTLFLLEKSKTTKTTSTTTSTKTTTSTSNSKYPYTSLDTITTTTTLPPQLNVYPLGPLVYNSEDWVLTTTSTLTGYEYGNGTYTYSSSAVWLGHSAGAVFDDNLTTYYQYSMELSPRTVTTIGSTSYTGEWIQIVLPEYISLTAYSVGVGDSLLNSPTSWIIAGSSDNGTTWELLSQINNPSLKTNTYITYSTGSEMYYNIFRFIFLSSDGLYPVLYGWRLYTSSSPLSSSYPAIWFKFDKGDITDTSVKNYGRYNQDGVLAVQGDASYASINTTNYKAGTGSIYFPGSQETGSYNIGSYMNFPPTIMPPAGGGFTMSFWFAVPYNTTIINWMRILDFGDVLGGNFNSITIGLFPETGMNNYLYLITTTNDTYNAILYMNYQFNDSTSSSLAWHLMVITWDSTLTENNLNIYMDGAASTGAPTFTYTATYPPTLSRTYMYIAKSRFTTENYPRLYLDDFRYYDYVINADEMDSIYKISTE